MSSSNGTPPVDTNRGDSSFGGGQANGLDAGEKPRLTEEEKKQNHIASGKLAPFRLSLIKTLASRCSRAAQNKNDGRPSAKASIAYVSWYLDSRGWVGPRASFCNGRWSS